MKLYSTGTTSVGSKFSLFNLSKEQIASLSLIDKLFLKTTHVYMKNNQKLPITIIAYLTDWMQGKVQNIDCQDSKWIDIKDIKQYNFVAADLPIVDKLLA